MSLIRYLSYTWVMVLLPVVCHAQECPSLTACAREQVGTLAVSSLIHAESQPTASRSAGRDSLLNGTLIGFAAGAGLGVADGRPEAFAGVIRHAIAPNGAFFNAQRVVEQSAHGAYRTGVSRS